MSLLSGRIGRRVFFCFYLGLVIGAAAVSLLTGNRYIADLVFFIPWLSVASKRLHDLNARWWWALAPPAAGFAEGFVKGVWRVATHTLEVSAASTPPTSNHVDWSQVRVLDYPMDFARGFAEGFIRSVGAGFSQYPFLYIVSSVLFFVLLLWPGSRGENRFGKQPGRRVTELSQQSDAHVRTQE